MHVNLFVKIIDKLDLDLHTDVINWREMRGLQISFFKAQLPNLDIPDLDVLPFTLSI